MQAVRDLWSIDLQVIRVNPYLIGFDWDMPKSINHTNSDNLTEPVCNQIYDATFHELIG